MRFLAFVLQYPPNVQELDGVPEFEVCDSSSISIKQIKTDLQRSLAENGFSAKSISTALYDLLAVLNRGLIDRPLVVVEPLESRPEFRQASRQKPRKRM